jgi:hypothetical protein
MDYGHRGHALLLVNVTNVEFHYTNSPYRCRHASFDAVEPVARVAPLAEGARLCHWLALPCHQ